jgi:hypothetical protein
MLRSSLWRLPPLYFPPCENEQSFIRIVVSNSLLRAKRRVPCCGWLLMETNSKLKTFVSHATTSSVVTWKRHTCLIVSSILLCRRHRTGNFVFLSYHDSCCISSNNPFFQTSRPKQLLVGCRRVVFRRNTDRTSDVQRGLLLYLIHPKIHPISSPT